VLELLLELNRTHQSGLVVVTHSPEIATRLGRKLTLADGYVVSAERFTDAPFSP
jgi:predicted ABC-type transport system involved in lysophospholipase L1 biosynthesis ATPase subunit